MARKRYSDEDILKLLREARFRGLSSGVGKLRFWTPTLQLGEDQHGRLAWLRLAWHTPKSSYGFLR